jgi:hypothetical protein
LAKAREVLEVLVDEGVGLTAESGEPVFDIGRVARLAHLAGVDDVETGIRLLVHDLGDRFGNAAVQGGRLDGHSGPWHIVRTRSSGRGRPPVCVVKASVLRSGSRSGS